MICNVSTQPSYLTLIKTSMRFPEEANYINSYSTDSCLQDNDDNGQDIRKIKCHRLWTGWDSKSKSCHLMLIY